MRNILGALLVVAIATGLAAQENVQVSVVAILIDEDLNQKPVPRLLLLIKPLDDSWTANVRTGFDGLASVDLPPGAYQISSESPTRFGNAEYGWNFTFDVPSTREVVLSNDNAVVEAIGPTQSPTEQRMTAKELFPALRDSVVTVWSAFGHGTGFFVDAAGLVITNDHVVGGSEYLAVQSDPLHKVEARLIERDPTNDLAVLWIAPGALPEVRPVTIANVHDSIPDLVEGDQVYTIGSPLNQRKIITAGIASKIESGAIISDININPGNSGGPLFNEKGEVVGITTFGESARIGPGVSGIVRIEAALRLIETARAKIGSTLPPSSALLPVEPDRPYPPALLKVGAERFDDGPYDFNSGNYSIQIITPISKYKDENESRMAAAREKNKRTKKAANPVKETFEPLSEIRNWAAYAGELQAVLQIRVQPRLKETVGSAIGRGLLAGAAAYAGTATTLPPAKLRFRSDFYRMELYCGSRVVQPIQPSKYEMLVDQHSGYYSATDATYAGFYTYPYDAINESCGSAFLRIYSEAEPDQPKLVSLKPDLLRYVSRDFAAYDRMVKFSSPPEETTVPQTSPTSVPAGSKVPSHQLMAGHPEGTFDALSAKQMLEQIHIGMSREEVLQLAGKPAGLDKIENVEMWKYSAGDRYLVVAFLNQRVSDKALVE